MRVVSRTHVGLIRENNEDALLVKEPHLFAVADGMGGYAAGEVASRSTLRAFEVGMRALSNASSDNVDKVLSEAFEKANSHVYKMAAKDSSLSGMGTTLTALYLQEERHAYCCHIGDSRLYLWRQGELHQLTSDHTVVANLRSQGKMTDDEARVHPMRHMLLKAVGVDKCAEADIFQLEFSAGDRVLLCSDGLTDMLDKREIAEILGRDDPAAAAEALEERALDNGGRDNISMIIIDFGDEGGVEHND